MVDEYKLLGDEPVGKTNWSKMNIAIEEGKTPEYILAEMVRCSTDCPALMEILGKGKLLEDPMDYFKKKADGCDFYDFFLKGNYPLPYCRLAEALGVMSEVRDGKGAKISTQ